MHRQTRQPSFIHIIHNKKQTTMSKKIFTLVYNESKVNRGRYNICKDKAEKLLHHDTCKQAIAFAERTGFPIGIVLYIGVGKDAHKDVAFNKGYKGFNEKKADLIVKMANEFAKHFNASEKMAHNDRLVHALCRYVEKLDNRNKLAFYRDCLNKLPKPTKGQKFSIKGIKTSADMNKFIFGDAVAYNESNGRIVGLV